jgi:aminomethyltransferase
VTDLRQSPLNDRHVAVGARMAEFGGWEMPIQYAGVVEEHLAVRQTVGIFDVSHLGKLRVLGAGAKDFLNSCLTNDLDRIGPGQAQYTLCCDPATGGVVDDLIAYVEDADRLLLVPNAANAAEVARRLSGAAPTDVVIEDWHERLAVIAVQGPQSFDVMAKAGLPTELDYMQHTTADWHGRPVIVCRTGYTGERGFELLPTWADAGALWDELLSVAAAYDAKPCGLGARDTLRTEMGYPLHGQDLSMDISPVQARAGWAVGWSKPEFWGKDALVAEKESGISRLLSGLLAQDRGIPRPHMTLRTEDGSAVVGEVTSGTFSPSLKTGIVLALLDRSVHEGQTLSLDVRGRSSAVRVVKAPFVEPHTR